MVGYVKFTTPGLNVKSPNQIQKYYAEEERKALEAKEKAAKKAAEKAAMKEAKKMEKAAKKKALEEKMGISGV